MKRLSVSGAQALWFTRSAPPGLVGQRPLLEGALGAGLRGLYCQAMMNLQIRRVAMPPGVRGRSALVHFALPLGRGHGTCVGVPIALRSGGMSTKAGHLCFFQ